MSANRMVASRRLVPELGIGRLSARRGALRGGAGRKTRDIIVEHLLALEAGGAEHHRKADLRADIDVGGAEGLAEQIGTIGERLLERRQDVVVAAPADGGFPL